MSVYDYVIVDAEHLPYVDSAALCVLVKFGYLMLGRRTTATVVLSKHLRDLFASRQALSGF